MNRLLLLIFIAAGIFVPSFCSAGAITIETVAVGNAGNLPHPLYGRGAVAYEFRIGKTEVTNAQYVAFLNAVAADDTHNLFKGAEDPGHPHIGIVRTGVSGSYKYSVKPPALGKGPGGTNYAYDNKPVLYMSWFDTLRFCNWLHNGQPVGSQDIGTTESGAYTFSGTTLVGPRTPAARWFLPSEDEWYKAAYYDGATGNYYEFAAGSNLGPSSVPPSADDGNSANIYDSVRQSYATGSFQYPLTDAGAYTLSASPYGTYDQGGSVWEWSETVVTNDSRRMRGGSWHGDVSVMGADEGYSVLADQPSSFIGFRLATIPEPTSLTSSAAAVLLLMLWRRRR